MKNIKKFYPLIVGLVLLISVAAYGTRAYFSDSTSEDAGIDLTLGDVKIGSKGLSWAYKAEIGNENNELKNNDKKVDTPNDMGNQINITDARPGDTFEKVFEFKNTGSLEQVVTFATDKNESSIFKVKWNEIENTNNEVVLDETKNFKLSPGKEVSLKMTVSVNLNSHEEQHGDNSVNTDKVTNLNTLVKESIEVKAVQTNATAAAK